MLHVGITHPEDHLSRFFTDADMARLKASCKVTVLGSYEEPGFYDRLGDIDIFLGSWGMVPLDQNLLDKAPNLKAVTYAAGSVKQFVTEESYARGVEITTAMHANAIPVAEVTVALITLANKNWFVCQETIQDQGQKGFELKDQVEPFHTGNYDTTVGLIGFGTIAKLVAERLQSMSMDVVVYDPYLTPEAAHQAGVTKVELLELARRCRISSLHAPNIPELEKMIGKDFLSAMPDNSTFINTARGALVDEDALVRELETGRIQALLDVTWPEPPAPDHAFYRLRNCWMTPHRAGSSANEIRRMGTYAIDEIMRFRTGKTFKYPVTQDMLATMA